MRCQLTLRQGRNGCAVTTTARPQGSAAPGEAHRLAEASDALLATRAADGDAAAFAALVTRHGPYLRAYAIRLTGSSADADDALQETLITAWQRLDRLENPAAVRGWLSSILTRKATDRLRSRRVTDEPVGTDEGEHEPIATDATPDARVETDTQLGALGRALDALPALERQCWLLREVGEHRYDEIAEQLGVSTATVRGALARARQSLVARMEEWR